MIEWFDIFSFDGLKHIKIMFFLCFALGLFNRKYYMYLFVFCIGLCKELSDLFFDTGIFEIKDIIANCFGIFLGYVFNLIHKLRR